MKPNPARAALILIDMENGFVEPEGGHCIRFAKSTVPACVRAVETAREKGIPVFFVKRIYRADGSDVELTRYEGWQSGGRAMRPASPSVPCFILPLSHRYGRICASPRPHAK